MLITQLLATLKQKYIIFDIVKSLIWAQLNCENYIKLLYS